MNGAIPSTAKALEDGAKPSTYPRGGREAYLIWGITIAAYMFSVTCRTSLAAMGIATAEHFHASSTMLSLFLYLQLFVYAIMQVPAGLLLDRFGSRRVIVSGVLLMSFGQLVMGLSPVFAWAVFGRAVVGMGDAMIFISVIRLVPVWFELRKVPLMNQLTSMLGGTGQIVSIYPFVWLYELTNWQAAFLTLATLGVLLAAAVWMSVRQTRAMGPIRHVFRVPRINFGFQHMIGGLKQSLATPGTICGFWVHAATWFPMNIMSSLWGIPFLLAVEGYTLQESSAFLAINLILGMVWAVVIGNTAGLHPIHGRAVIVYSTILTQMAVWTAVLVTPGPHPTWLMVLLLLSMSSGAPASNIAFDYARDTNDPRNLGAASGLANTGGFISAAITLLGVGIVLDALGAHNPAHYTDAAMRLAFTIQYPLWIAGLVGFSVMLPKTLLAMRRRIQSYDRPASSKRPALPKKAAMTERH